MKIFRDQMNRDVPLSQCPQRIVSLVPSISELLFDLGLEERVVGITKFCIHPSQWIKTKTIVGGTKTLKTEVISALAPDLIIGAKEENERNQIEPLMKMSPLYIADVKTIHDALDLIRSLGAICGVTELSQPLSVAVERHLLSIQHKTKGRVAYLIWNRPLMCAGAGTYIHSVLTWMGYENVLSLNTDSRYPEMTVEALRALYPDIIFLSSEPYPFCEKQKVEFQAFFPQADIRCVDGEMFSWYGSRMLRIQIPDEHVSL